jgi:transcriptional regulator with XRE-family HTH domain
MTEYEQARLWRQRLGLTQRQLADLTGYSVESISHYENGTTPSRSWSDSKRKVKANSRPIDAFVWFRYKRCCAAVDAEMRTKKVFKW